MNRNRFRDVAFIVVTILIALVTLRQSAKAPGELSTLDRWILALSSPAQSGMSHMLRGVGNVAGRYVDLIRVRQENEKLRSENQKLRTELLEARQLAQESGRYQRLLGLRDTTPAEMLAARVVSMDATPYFRVARVLIDRGDAQVKRGMPVLAAEGVVGRINKASGRTSDVMLAVDPRSSIDVPIPRTGGRGILRGKAGENGYLCTIEYLTRGEPVREGDAVVTSGVGGLFPRDIPVGKISKVIGNSVGLYQDVEVTPEVNFARLSEVLVVVAPPPPADPEAGTKRAAPPARGVSVYR